MRTSSSRARQAPSVDPVIEQMVGCYGDLLFDLCESVLWSPVNAQLAFRSILRELGRHCAANDYKAHERAWVLKVACDRLRVLAARHGRKTTSSEQIELDANPAAAARLKSFDFYFHRLGTDDKLLLLLKDKYGIPCSEISSAMGMPEGSLKTRRGHALRTLEDWIWNSE